MKKHLSVLMLFIRSTIFKILILLAVMSAVELVLFKMGMNSAGVAEIMPKDHGQGIEAVILNSRISWVFGIAYILGTVILLKMSAGAGGKSNYTFGRLSISEHAVFGWQSVCNAGMYFVMWAVQSALALLMCRWYSATADPALLSGQTVFLAFYRSQFLHSLMPMENVLRWVRNILLCAGLGAASAGHSYRQRQGKRSMEIFILGAAAILLFNTLMENRVADCVLILLSAGLFINIVYEMKKEAHKDEAELY